jgi:hypothetical protein
MCDQFKSKVINMNDGFQETIKQKTDKELEIISKDYVFYSEEERLVALNELESRNCLSEELLMNKKNIESLIEKPTITEQALEAVQSTKRIYKENAIWVGAYIGCPLVAGYFIAENFKSFNEINNAKKTWLVTIIGTIMIFCGISLIPDNVFDKIPNFIIPLFYAAIAYGVVKQCQSKNLSAFIAIEGRPFGWWRIIIISLIGLAITFAIILGFTFLLYFSANS